jgi:hypothetical protein
MINTSYLKLQVKMKMKVHAGVRIYKRKAANYHKQSQVVKTVSHFVDYTKSGWFRVLN